MAGDGSDGGIIWKNEFKDDFILKLLNCTVGGHWKKMKMSRMIFKGPNFFQEF